MRNTKMFVGRLAIVGGLAFGQLAGISVRAAEVCVTNGSGPDICVNKMRC